MAVADVFDAITSKRHYRDKMPIINVIDILLKGAGTHFQKELVDTFLAIPVTKIINVFLSESNGKMEPDDEQFLVNYSLTDIYRIGTSEVKTEDENKVFDMFNNYYQNGNGGPSAE